MKNKKHLFGTPEVESEESEGTWAISYGDLITLLLSFFVIFFSTDPAQEKLKKMNQFLEFQLEGLAPVGNELEKVISSNLETDQVNLNTLKDINISAEKVGDSLVVSFGAISFFRSGQAELRNSSKKVLDAFLERYMNYAGSYILSIKGFTDKNPISKSRYMFKDNLELSAMRSLAAMRYLREKGLPFRRMEIAGQGELKSISTVLKQTQNLSQKELDAISRTLVFVIKPEVSESI